MFTLDPEVLTLVIGTLIPILVAIITKEVTAPAVKAWLLAAASAATGIATSAQAAGGLVAGEAVVYGVMTMVIAIATYYGFWRPTGIAPKVAEVTDKHHIGLEVKPKA